MGVEVLTLQWMSEKVAIRHPASKKRADIERP